MKIYTRSGDTGKTSLCDGFRVSKDHPRVRTYGTLDQLNSLLGIVNVHLTCPKLQAWTKKVQQDLFALASWLSSPKACKNIIEGKEPWGNETMAKLSISPKEITEMEATIDEWESKLEPLRFFILPGGTEAAAHAHHARTVCRQAERECVLLMNSGEDVPPLVIQYLNRLADALFVFSRYINHQAHVEETKWT